MTEPVQNSGDVPQRMKQRPTALPDQDARLWDTSGAGHNPPLR